MDTKIVGLARTRRLGYGGDNAIELLSPTRGCRGCGTGCVGVYGHVESVIRNTG